MDIPEGVYLKALLFILQGLALDYYYNARLIVFMFEDICKSLRGFFKGLSFEYKSLNK